MQQTANQQMRRLKRQQRKRQARRERGPIPEITLVHHEATPVSRWAFIRHYFCPR